MPSMFSPQVKGYVTLETQNLVSICKDPDGLTGCVTSNGPRLGGAGTFNYPTAIAFLGCTAYVVNYQGASVSICTNATGLTNCTTSQGPGYRGTGVASTFSGPVGIAFYNGLGYVTNAGSSSVSICDCATAMIDCRTSTGGGTFSAPYSIAFYNGWAYVANEPANSVSICKNTYDLTSCTRYTGEGKFGFPTSISFYNNWAYVTSSGGYNAVVICRDPINLVNCTSYNGQGTFQYPIATAFYLGHAYTSNTNTAAVTKCQDATNLATNCTSIPGFPSPYGIAFYPTLPAGPTLVCAPLDEHSWSIS